MKFSSSMILSQFVQTPSPTTTPFHPRKTKALTTATSTSTSSRRRVTKPFHRLRPKKILPATNRLMILRRVLPRVLRVLRSRSHETFPQPFVQLLTKRGRQRASLSYFASGLELCYLNLLLRVG